MWSGGVTPGIWDNALRHASATKTTQVTTWLILFCMFFSFLSVLCSFPKEWLLALDGATAGPPNSTVQLQRRLALLPCSEATLTGCVYQEDETRMNSRLFRRAVIDRLCMNCAR